MGVRVTTNHDQILQAIHQVESKLSDAVHDVKAQLAGTDAKVDSVARTVTELKEKSKRDSGRLNDVEADIDKRKGRDQIIKFLLGGGIGTAIIGAVLAFFHKGNG